MEHSIDGGGRLLDAVPLLQEEFDLVLADSGFGSSAIIGSELGYELLVMLGSLMRQMMKPSGQGMETSPAMFSIPLDPFDNCGARSSENAPGKGDIVSIGKEELDHGAANRLRVLRISDTLIV